MENVSKDIKEKAMLLLEQKKVKKEIETNKRIHFKVQGETEVHSVIFDKGRNYWECDCKFWSLKQKECSHIIACKLMNKG